MLRKKSVWIALACLVVLSVAGQLAYRTLSVKQEDDTYKVLREGDAFPPQMPLMGADGKFKNFSDYKGQVVLINFWAAWCGPCIQEMPSLYALHKKLQGRGFLVLGVAMDDNMAQGITSLDRLVGPAPFTMVKGPEQAIAARFSIEGLPFTVVVDRKGTIIYAKAGERDWSNAESMKFLEGLL